jgi:hypothetical protein
MSAAAPARGPRRRAHSEVPAAAGCACAGPATGTQPSHPIPRQVNEYLQSQGRATKKAAVIHSNPEQSKHLETARMKVNDLWIDLVNLRSETYAEGSRIPTMEFGTPLQDAERRCGARDPGARPGPTVCSGLR